MDPQLPETTIVSPALKQSPADHQPGKKNMFIIISMVIVLLVVIAAGAFFLTKGSVKLPPPAPVVEQPIQGASFLLSADPMEPTVGKQIKVTVLVKSDADTANLFIAKLKFPNDLLEAKSISLRSESSSSGFIQNWFISNWVENTIDNNTGSVSLVGGVPTPGFKTQPESSGSAMADVIFMARASGDATISFDDTSTVYRNSDNANILVAKQGITLKITGEASSAAILTPTPKLQLTPVSSPSATPSGPLEGDVNQDGKVDLQDLSSLLSAWGVIVPGTIKADLNNDGVVNAFDYSRLTKILRNSDVIQ